MFGFGSKTKTVKKEENPKIEEQVNPLDQPADAKKENAPQIIKGIVSTESGEKPEAILEAAPEIDTSLLQEIEPQKSILLMVLKILFVVLIVLGIGSLTFFTSQLTTKFEVLATRVNLPNVSRDLTSTNAEILTLQTDLNFHRYLQVKAYLDRFSFLGDAFMQGFEIENSQTSSAQEVRDAQDQMASLKNGLRESFLAAKEKYLLPFDAPIFTQEEMTDAQKSQQFQQKLKAKLNEKASELKSNEDPEAQRDFKNYDHTANLIANSGLRSLFINTDFDALTDAQLYNLIKDMNDVIVNELSIIQKIKNKRVKWSDVMNEIRLRTIDVDRFYNEGTYDQLGGIRYNSYDLDTENRTISISGETKRFDTTNFTMISDLIDMLNGSPFFESAEMRSFTKSGSLDTGYTASLKLTLDLQDIDFTKNDTTTDVKELPNL